MNNTTHAFKSPLGRDLFALGLEMAQAHKTALMRQESVLEALAQIGKPTAQDWQEAAEMDAWFRNMESVPSGDESYEKRTEGRP